jgi:hypothetical protein
MDTEKFIPSQELDIENLTLLTLSDEELDNVSKYLEITRHLQEVHQLFSVFRYNLSSLLHTYELTNSDQIKRLKPYVEEFDDRTEVNALVINYISSGKTLVDSLDSCIAGSYSTDETPKKYQEIVSSIYDEWFSYRLLVRMRDFSQHGHLPVSIDNNTFCFDIAQIVATPHFNHNKSLQKQMDRFVEELLVTYDTQPHYAFSMAIAEYTASMAKIYYEFWIAIKSAFISYKKSVCELIQTNPECIIHEDKRYYGWVFYLIDKVLHCFNSNEDSFAWLKGYTDEAKHFYNSQNSELQIFKASIRMVKPQKRTN